MRFHLRIPPSIGRFLEKESRIEVTRGWGEGGSGELLFNGYRVFVGDNEKV